MSNYENSCPKIYYRPLRKWIEVTQEKKNNWERFVGTIRKANQRAGSCCIPYEKSYRCDGICDGCEFRCKQKNEPLKYSINTELDRVYKEGFSKSCLLGDKNLITEINIDTIILNDLLNELKSRDPESYKILMVIIEGRSDRDSAKILNMPKTSYFHKKKSLLKSLKKFF